MITPHNSKAVTVCHLIPPLTTAIDLTHLVGLGSLSDKKNPNEPSQRGYISGRSDHRTLDKRAKPANINLTKQCDFPKTVSMVNITGDGVRDFCGY